MKARAPSTDRTARSDCCWEISSLAINASRRSRPHRASSASKGRGCVGSEKHLGYCGAHDRMRTIEPQTSRDIETENGMARSLKSQVKKKVTFLKRSASKKAQSATRSLASRVKTTKKAAQARLARTTKR